MAIDVPDQRLIHPHEIDEWADRVYRTSQSDEQRRAFQNLCESCVRFITRRAEVYLAAMQFHAAEILNRTTVDVQAEFFYRTEVFFHGYYSCVSQLANVVHRHPRPMGAQIAASSNQRFIAGVCALDGALGEHALVLEEARAHRAFLDHPVSNRVSNWFTTTTGDERILQVVFFGHSGDRGQMPEHAVRAGAKPVDADWYKFTPSTFTVEQSLKTLVLFVVDRIALFEEPRDSEIVGD